MSISTKTGDDGSTGLMFGRRVAKTDRRVAACGTCDELNAALGLARAFGRVPDIGRAVGDIQRDLVALMGELAVADEDAGRYAEAGYRGLEAAAVARLERMIEDLENSGRVTFAGWAMPGENRGGACLDVARTVCRRAEREVLALRAGCAHVNPEAVRYLNRLADLCWLWARVEEGAGEREHPAGGLPC